MKIDFGKITVILRGFNYAQVECVASVLDGSGVRNMEITLNTPNASQMIGKIEDEFGRSLNIGAGTVLSAEDVKLVANCGARFALSPSMMSQEMIDLCHENDMLAIPGSLTPAEICESFRRGADIVKVFPANEFTRSYASKVIEPFGDLRLMAVGGVRIDNVAEFIAGGFQFVGSAGGIFSRADILSQNVASLGHSLAVFQQATATEVNFERSE